jgi:hypothetical protein
MFIKVQDKKVTYINYLRDAKDGEGITVNEIPKPEDNGMIPILMYDNGEFWYEYQEVSDVE